MRTYATPGDLAADVGARLGASAWREIDQDLIDRFADLTDDHQWVHVDQVRAEHGPFGSTVAHGLLTLSLLPGMLTEIFEVGGTDALINKGVDRLRFKAPVPAGARVRAVADLVSVTRSIRGFTELVVGVVIEIEGSAREALRTQVRVLAHAVEEPDDHVAVGELDEAEALSAPEENFGITLEPGDIQTLGKTSAGP